MTRAQYNQTPWMLPNQLVSYFIPLSAVCFFLYKAFLIPDLLRWDYFILNILGNILILVIKLFISYRRHFGISLFTHLKIWTGCHPRKRRKKYQPSYLGQYYTAKLFEEYFENRVLSGLCRRSICPCQKTNFIFSAIYSSRRSENCKSCRFT